MAVLFSCGVVLGPGTFSRWSRRRMRARESTGRMWTSRTTRTALTCWRRGHRAAPASSPSSTRSASSPRSANFLPPALPLVFGLLASALKVESSRGSPRLHLCRYVALAGGQVTAGTKVEAGVRVGNERARGCKGRILNKWLFLWTQSPGGL